MSWATTGSAPCSPATGGTTSGSTSPSPPGSIRRSPISSTPPGASAWSHGPTPSSPRCRRTHSPPHPPPPLRKPIASNADIHGVFDGGTTYSKGASLLGQLEGWLGEAPLRETLRHYVREHEWGSVTSEDFLTALRTHLTPDAERVLRGYLDQPGVPRVSAELQCTPGKAPRLRLPPARP